MTGDFLDRALAAPPEPGEERQDDAETALAQRLREAERRLRRLYALYAAAEDEVLAESIAAQKRLLDALRAEAEREAETRANAEAEVGRREEFRRLAQAWEHMTQAERRAVARELIERVEIDGQNVSIHYRL